MYKRSESYFTGYQDMRLYAQAWEVESPKGVLIITHGHGEHSGSYHRVVDTLKNENISIFAWDLRGHGKSDGQRGYSLHFNDYVHDYECFLNQLKKESWWGKVPAVALGHSMGGLIQLKTLLSHNYPEIKAYAVSAPMLGVALQVPAYKQIAAEILVNLLPKVTLSNEIKHTSLTRDQLVIKEFESDPIRHDRISSGVYLGSLQAMEFVKARAEQIRLPFLMQISDSDPVVSTSEAVKFFEKIPKGNKHLYLYKNRKHEIYNDLEREEPYSDLKGFLKQLFY